MSEELVVLADARVMGQLLRSRGGRLSFRYDPDWRAAASSFPLSLSMPMTAAAHPHAAVESFLWGLLPDNPWIVDRWARRFQVSPRNVFALLAQVGEDCAGAIQLLTPERLAALEGSEPAAIEWLDEADVAARLRALRADASAWRRAEDIGQFSLAGAQPKTALLRQGTRWGIPSGREPTTHLIKPPIEGLDGHAENEHFCLALARGLGLPTASSWVASFEDEVAIVVERYDRVRDGQRTLRIHQEDLCQALALHPDRKYESDGGPGAEQVASFLFDVSTSADDDVATFRDALALNWLIGGTDAHAKNYSLLLGAGGRTRLAPLYDLASILPYESAKSSKLRLAMKVGAENRLGFVAGRHWRRLATSLRVDPDALVTGIADLASRLPDLARDTLEKTRREGLSQGFLPRLADDISQRATECKGRLAH